MTRLVAAAALGVRGGGWRQRRCGGKMAALGSAALAVAALNKWRRNASAAAVSAEAAQASRGSGSGGNAGAKNRRNHRRVLRR